MSTPFYQSVDPQPANDPVTPADTPSNPSGYAGVMPHGQGPAPYNIEAPLEDLTAVVAGAREMSGGQEGTNTGFGASGFANMMSPRQAATAKLLDSPAGFSAGGGTSGYDITPGWSGSPDDPGNGWPNNPQPIILETPDQGQMNTYPQSNTGTD
jgi:hypothetical protein